MRLFYKCAKFISDSNTMINSMTQGAGVSRRKALKATGSIVAGGVTVAKSTGLASGATDYVRTACCKDGCGPDECNGWCQKQVSPCATARSQVDLYDQCDGTVVTTLGYKCGYVLGCCWPENEPHEKWLLTIWEGEDRCYWVRDTDVGEGCSSDTPCDGTISAACDYCDRNVYC